MTSADRQPNRVKETLITSHVFGSFRQMHFTRKLKQINPATGVEKTQRKRKTKFGFAEDRRSPAISKRNAGLVTGKDNIRVGDVVSILPDETDKLKWQKSGDE
jgi:hypothetical protein